MTAARHRLTPRILAALALAGSALSVPALGQSDPEARIKKLEAEVRALQRKVFPGGDGKYFEAQIAPPNAAAATPVDPTVSTGPVNDLLARVDAIETALARITAQSEEGANRAAKLEARLVALEASGASAPVVLSTPAATGGATAQPASITGSLAANTAAMAATSAARPSADRLGAVAAIEKPMSNDQGEDDYLYGYRLWEAKFFPEAAQQLKLTVDTHPRHKRVSYARNLLGRAYLEDNKPGTAAKYFLENYQADKAGDRAPDSLLYLAIAMTRLKETNRACVALAEFADAYPAEAAGRLANQYGAAKSAVTCN